SALRRPCERCGHRRSARVRTSGELMARQHGPGTLPERSPWGTKRWRKVIAGDCLEVLPALPAGFARLAYVDPPFNTGRTQRRNRLRVQATEGEGRIGFGGRRYVQERVPGAGEFDDAFGDFPAFLMPRIEACLRCLTPDGSLFVHL